MRISIIFCCGQHRPPSHNMLVFMSPVTVNRKTHCVLHSFFFSSCSNKIKFCPLHVFSSYYFLTFPLVFFLRSDFWLLCSCMSIGKGHSLTWVFIFWCVMRRFDVCEQCEKLLLSDMLPFSRASNKCFVGNKLRLAVLNCYFNSKFLLVYSVS